MHIVLVSTPLIFSQKTEPYFPLGILNLHRILSDSGHDCRIYAPQEKAINKIDPNIMIQRWAAEIAATNPDWIGYSTMCGSYPLILLLAKRVKHILPQSCNVLGGPQASVVADKTITAFPWIDFIIRGEAESVIQDFAGAIAGKVKTHEVSNLTYRENGKTFSTPMSLHLKDLDFLPLPDYQAYPHFESALFGEDFGINEDSIPLEAGRGCPYACSFCSTSNFWQRRRRQKSPDLLVEQIKSVAHKYKINAVTLRQDLFAIEGDWLSDFLRLKEAHNDIIWSCSLRADSVSTQTIAKMQRVGCRNIFFGIESGSQRVQKLIGKNLNISKTKETIEAAVACGISVETGFIIGFPWETGDDIQDTLSLHQHFLKIGVEYSHLSMLCPLPKTQITNQYSSQLMLDPVEFAHTTNFEYVRNSEIDQMIRQYPQIFSSFYYVKTEFLSHKELFFAVRAANALSAFERAVKS